MGDDVKPCTRCRRRAQGLCIDCNAPAVDGKRRCAKHLEHHSRAVVKSREKRIAERKQEVERERAEAREAWL